eukprot:SAG31_NODE_24631_length_477_cov_1.224868_1_plen_51_part_10
MGEGPEPEPEPPGASSANMQSVTLQRWFLFSGSVFSIVHLVFIAWTYARNQ